MAIPLNEKALDLLRGPNLAWIATTNSDGSPQVTPVWIDTDGTNVVFNTAEGRVKTNNLRRDPRVSVGISDVKDIYRYVNIKGRVIEMTNDGGDEHINKLSHKYGGKDYRYTPGEVRVIVVVEPEKIGTM